MQVKRPAVGAEGYVLSHYDRGALDRYLDQVGARLLPPFAGRLPFAIFCDSLEVYDSDWSPDFAAEFAARRGYDIAPLLPLLAADRGVDGAMVREDWGRTLTELLDERFIAPLAAWARERGTRLRIQGYGIPPATRVEQRRRGPAGRRGPPLARAHRVALGLVGQPPVRQARRHAARRGRGCTRRRFARRRSTSRPRPTGTSCRASRSSSATAGHRRLRARPIRAGVSTPPASSTTATRGGLRCRTCRATCSA